MISDEPDKVSRTRKEGRKDVENYRRAMQGGYYFNWMLKIDPVFQMPFEPTHKSMRALALHRDQPVHLIAANLRKAFSGIVAGNVKETGIRAIEERGPYRLTAEAGLMAQMDVLLQSFVAQSRMKLPGSHYEPCYKLEG